jgi:hypothetical protein
MRPNNPLPVSPEGWLVEVAEAYHQARQMRRSGRAHGDQADACDLSLLAPLVALKFRRLRRSQGKLAKASDAVLASHLVTSDDADFLKEPQLVFAFSYVASHYGLGMLTETEAEGVMDYVERHRKKLERVVNAGKKPDTIPQPTTLGRLFAWLRSWGARGRVTVR